MGAPHRLFEAVFAAMAVGAVVLATACSRPSAPDGAPAPAASEELYLEVPAPPPPQNPGASTSAASSSSPSPSPSAADAGDRRGLPDGGPRDGGARRDAGGPCGGEDCPLQGWMKANMGPAATAKDFKNLALGLITVGGWAPPGYANWVSIARDGLDAARHNDLEAVRAACRGCHDQYKARYRAELRARPLPPVP